MGFQSTFDLTEPVLLCNDEGGVLGRVHGPMDDGALVLPLDVTCKQAPFMLVNIDQIFEAERRHRFVFTLDVHMA